MIAQAAAKVSKEVQKCLHPQPRQQQQLEPDHAGFISSIFLCMSSESISE